MLCKKYAFVVSDDWSLWYGQSVSEISVSNISDTTWDSNDNLYW